MPDATATFNDFVADFNFDIEVDATGTFVRNLATIPTPFGAGDSPALNAGLVILVDLIFELEGKIDLTTGAHVTVPNGAFLGVNLLTHSIEDGSAGSL